jgi:hypothetical protein
MDTLLAVRRLPRLADRAMRDAVVVALARGRMSPRSLVNDALMRFERAVRDVDEGVRPALLFAERDRIVRELRRFIEGRLAARLAALPRRDLVAAGAQARPFHAVVRARGGRTFAVAFLRLPEGRSLDVLRRVAEARNAMKTPVDGVLIYDFGSGRVRLVSDDAGTNCVHRNLRAS